MDKEYDIGDIFLQKTIAIDPRDNSQTLLNKCSKFAVDSLDELLDILASDLIVTQPQAHQFATQSPQINKYSGLVNWNTNADAIARKVRALFPWFQAYGYHNEQRIQFSDCEIKSVRSKAIPGQIIECYDKDLLVAAKDSCLLLKTPTVTGLHKRDSLNYIERVVKTGNVLR